MATIKYGAKTNQVCLATLSFFKKLYSYTNTGSAYILELEQIHARKSGYLRLARFSGHKKRIFSSRKAQKA